MNNKKMIVIPALSKFEYSLGIYGRKINAAVFIPNKRDHTNVSLRESALWQLKFLEIVGWFTNEKGFQRGAHWLKKLHDICSKGEIDMTICCSKEEIVGHESDSESLEESIMKYDTSFYCIKDHILIKADEIISLS